MIPYIPRCLPWRDVPPAEISASITEIGRHGIPGIEVTYLGGNEYHFDCYVKAGQPCE